MSDGWSLQHGSLDIATLQKLYLTRTLRPTELVEAVYERVAHCSLPNIWIYLLPRESVLAQALELEARWESGKAGMPLYGIPYAIKDNIDAAGHPTTAACPEFRYVPTESAISVNRLNSSGALLIGKTNLDQFATGLVGLVLLTASVLIPSTHGLFQAGQIPVLQSPCPLD